MSKRSEGSTPAERGASEHEGPSPDELSALWDAPSSAVLVVDRDLRILRVNTAYAHLAAESPEALVGRLLKEVAPLTAGPIGAIAAQAFASAEPVTGVRIPYNFAELSVDVLPVEAGGPEARAVVVISDTQRRPIAAEDGASGARRGFFDVARRMARATTAETAEAVVATLKFATQTYGLERAYVRLLTADEAHYVTPYEHDRPGVAALAARLVPAESIAWAHAQFVRGEAVVLSSLDEIPPDARAFRAALEDAGVQSTVGVPVRDGPRFIGYVAYTAREGRAWSRVEIDLLRLLGEMIAAIVVRAHTEAGVRARMRFEEQLSAATRRFVDIAPEDVDPEIGRTLSTLGDSLDVDRALVMVTDEAGEALSVTHEWCAPGAPSVQALFAGRRVEVLSPLVRRTLAGEAIVGRAEGAAPGSATEELLRHTGAHAVVLAPLHVEERVRGVMMLQSSTHRRHAPEDQVLARAKLVADVIAAALSHRAARERSRRWERRFAQILESAMDGVVLLDAAGVVNEWTPQATAVFGRDRAQMVGAALASVIYEADRDALAARLAKAAGPASPPQRFELRGLAGDGRVVPVELSMTRLERAEGCLVASFVRDITDRKRADAERERAFAEVSRQKRTLERERDYLREEQSASLIVGESAAIRGAFALLEAVADTASSVLLLGESGVGKEVFATALHAQSKRSGAPFVKVNCASVPGSLFESEFFGHVKGSFTGAVRDRIGRFELADGGTLFLDEVGEIPLELQAKLLRVLQEGEIERVGEDRTRRLDVRIVTATNRDLEQEVAAGRFRRDLYFRLGVFPISIPPLRERGQDAVLLARHFLQRHAAEARRSGLSLSPDDEARLLAYDWPGNVRELDHVLQRAVILSRTPPLRLDLALPYRGAARSEAPPELLREDDLRRMERENLALALKRASGRVSGPGGAAELLGMHPSTLRDRMKAFGISRPD
jgi:PAS domain S-box-containing protein